MSITLALPSKGRLKEQAVETLQAAGFTIAMPENDRRYRATMKGYPGIEVAFLSASEIARELDRGAIDMGVTGEDLVRETIADWEGKVDIAARLGFGRADVVVAVPEVWFDVATMADLDDVAADFRQRHGRRLRIATKYWRLTQQFFSQKHGIQVYRIVESLGATEGAPAAGSADIIVDITTTGSTLAANHLKVLDDGVILRSQACLVEAVKERGAEDAALAQELARRLGASSVHSDAQRTL
ncbi:ATP phosphoribosyltransferase [Nitratireductor thuwali]|uniref:ATP phosphoribosyltransferase n=1 Tax=Nitratireductor thuwali TaxID=2267699 RepID=A0ABY5MMN6_9HYPH|nr:ATP phosphoribosyltransferase [Nitratireductor thuwali]